jgi:hypothetical protein
MTTRTDIGVALVVLLCFVPGVIAAVWLAVSVVRFEVAEFHRRRAFRAGHRDWSAGRRSL